MKILVVEDSDALRKSIVIGLSHLGFTVEEAEDGKVGLDIAMNNNYDLIILDLMLPSVDGMEILETLRKNNNNVKILILSARNKPSDKVDGLMLGADDYLAKPFVFDELHARVLALLRRDQHFCYSNELIVGDYRLNLANHDFTFQNQLIKLTISEYKIIEYLFRRVNTVVSIDSLISAVAGNFEYISKNTLQVHISSIRKKIKACGGDIPLKHKRGYGYIIEN